MNHVVTSDLLEAYSQCHRKALFMLRGEPKGVEHEYGQMLTERASGNRKEYIDSFTELAPGRRELSGRLEECREGFVATQDLRADCDAVSQRPRRGQKKHVPFQPHLVVGTHSVTRGQRLRLAFAGVVIGELRRYRPTAGFIVPVAQTPRRVRIEALYPVVRSTVADLRRLMNAPPSEPPLLMLNMHCETCCYHQY